MAPGLPLPEVKSEPATPARPTISIHDPTCALSPAPSLRAMTPKRIKRPTARIGDAADGVGGTSSATDTPVTGAASPTGAAAAAISAFPAAVAAAAAAQHLLPHDLLAGLGGCHMGESGSPSEGSGNATLSALLGMHQAFLAPPGAAGMGMGGGGGGPAYSTGPVTLPGSYGGGGTTSDDNPEGDDDRARLRREKNRCVGVRGVNAWGLCMQVHA